MRLSDIARCPKCREGTEVVSPNETYGFINCVYSRTPTCDFIFILTTYNDKNDSYPNWFRDD